MRPLFLQVLLAALFLSLASGFLHHNGLSTRATIHLRASEDAADPNEIIAKRIKLSGDCQGGYYRACVKNEASRFRNLSGTMSPPDESKEAEVYVEGKRRQVESFVRWCKRSDVGLSQVIKVTEVLDEDPVGLYDDFYVQTQ